MTRLGPAATGLDAKRTAMLLHDARAVLRKVDVLAATALAIDDPTLPAITELRSAAEHLVAQLARREAHQQRRAWAEARRAR